jgi:hypothetical protein
MDKTEAKQLFEEIKKMPTDTVASMRTAFDALTHLFEQYLGAEEQTEQHHDERQKDKGTRGGH